MQVEPTSLFYATVIFLIKEDLLLDELIIGLYSPRVYYYCSERSCLRNTYF